VLGLGLRKREQLTLRRGQVDFSRNVVVATRTKGRKNREIPLDVLNPEVREILNKACHGKDAEDYGYTAVEIVSISAVSPPSLCTPVLSD
jgi:integrase